MLTTIYMGMQRSLGLTHSFLCRDHHQQARQWQQNVKAEESPELKTAAQGRAVLAHGRVPRGLVCSQERMSLKHADRQGGFNG